MTTATRSTVLTGFTVVCLMASGALLWHEITLPRPQKDAAPRSWTPPLPPSTPSPANQPSTSIELHPSLLLNPHKHAQLQTLQGLSNQWNQNNHLFLRLTPNESVDIAFLRQEAYTGPLLVSYTKAPDYGTYAVALNKTPLASLDGWGPSIARATYEIPNASLKAGSNVLTLICTGKNQNSTGLLFGIDSLEIPPTKPTK